MNAVRVMSSYLKSEEKSPTPMTLASRDQSESAILPLFAWIRGAPGIEQLADAEVPISAGLQEYHRLAWVAVGANGRPRGSPFGFAPLRTNIARSRNGLRFTRRYSQPVETAVSRIKATV